MPQILYEKIHEMTIGKGLFEDFNHEKTCFVK